jgi:hypothetical protein
MLTETDLFTVRMERYIYQVVAAYIDQVDEKTQKRLIECYSKAHDQVKTNSFVESSVN